MSFPFEIIGESESLWQTRKKDLAEFTALAAKHPWGSYCPIQRLILTRDVFSTLAQWLPESRLAELHASPCLPKDYAFLAKDSLVTVVVRTGPPERSLLHSFGYQYFRAVRCPKEQREEFRPRGIEGATAYEFAMTYIAERACLEVLPLHPEHYLGAEVLEFMHKATTQTLPELCGEAVQKRSDRARRLLLYCVVSVWCRFLGRADAGRLGESVQLTTALLSPSVRGIVPELDSMALALRGIYLRPSATSCEIDHCISDVGRRFCVGQPAGQVSDYVPWVPGTSQRQGNQGQAAAT